MVLNLFGPLKLFTIFGAELKKVNNAGSSISIYFHSTYIHRFRNKYRYGYGDKLSAAWGNWKKCSGMLCDGNMQSKLKGMRYTEQW